MEKIQHVELRIPVHQANTLKRILSNHESSSSREISQIIDIVYEINNAVGRLWNPEYNQSERCTCGHPYERHFDGYDDMRAVGCKYCECFTFSKVV